MIFTNNNHVGIFWRDVTEELLQSAWDEFRQKKQKKVALRAVSGERD